MNRSSKFIVLAFLLILPSCGPTEYSFKTAGDIRGVTAIEVPRTATGIHVSKDSIQHVATFTAETDDLESWVKQMRELKPELNGESDNPDWLAGTTQPVRDQMIELERGIFELRIGSDSGFSERLLKYSIRRSSRGGAITIWHDPQDGRTYLWAIYH